MADPYLGEIRIFGGNFAPRGWALCNGQIMSITQNTALFSLLGTAYGGNGTSTFGLPNFQGCAPMHWGNGAGLTPRVVGEQDGTPTVTLLSSEVAAHSHGFNCGTGSKGENSTVGNQVPADEKTGGIQTYSTSKDATTMSPAMIAPTPASQPHENMQPFLVLSFIIALQGVYPPRG
jgi:microcystin-dependent protein